MDVRGKLGSPCGRWRTTLKDWCGEHTRICPHQCKRSLHVISSSGHSPHLICGFTLALKPWLMHWSVHWRGRWSWAPCSTALLQWSGQRERWLQSGCCGWMRWPRWSGGWLCLLPGVNRHKPRCGHSNSRASAGAVAKLDTWWGIALPWLRLRETAWGRSRRDAAGPLTNECCCSGKDFHNRLLPHFHLHRGGFMHRPSGHGVNSHSGPARGGARGYTAGGQQFSSAQ